MKKLFFIVGLLSLLTFFSCQNEENVYYSCDEAEDAWVKENLSSIRKMETTEWFSISEKLKLPVYRAFSLEQKQSVWMEKLEDVMMNNEWKTEEIEHLQQLYDALSMHSEWLIPNTELGFFYDGAGIDICDINKNGTPDLLMMVYDAPEGENSFRYQIAFDLQSNGNYLSLSPVYEVPGLGHDGDGAGVAVGDIDNNGTLDILFMALDAPSGKDKFVYEILPDIDKYGNSYAKPIYTPRFPDSLSPCDTGQGAACCLYDLDNNGFLDAIFVAIENIKGKSNSWKYVTGHNLNKQGVPMCWR